MSSALESHEGDEGRMGDDLERDDRGVSLSSRQKAVDSQRKEECGQVEKGL